MNFDFLNPTETVRRHPLAAFFALACGISWLLWAPLWLPAFGVHGLPVLPFHHALGALGPITAAFLVSGRESGRAGTAGLWRHMGLWHGRLGWLAIALLVPYGLLAVAVVGATVSGKDVASLAGFGRSPEFPQFSAFGFFAYSFFSFGYGEETGWRGFALPRLQARHSALAASLLLTLGWALWHVPLFLYRPGYTGMHGAALAGWIFSLATGSVLLTWLYNESRGSILVAALFHATIDVAFTSNAATPSVVSVVGAAVTIWGIIVLVAAGPRSLSRRGKVTLEGPNRSERGKADAR